MYCVVESPKVLNLPISGITNIKYMKANRDNMFICIITSNDIMIWFTTVSFLRYFTLQNPNENVNFNLLFISQSSMLVAFYQRADNSVSIHGENHLVEWKNDSSKIAILVFRLKFCIFFFKTAYNFLADFYIKLFISKLCFFSIFPVKRLKIY